MQTLWSPWKLFFPCPLERYAMELRRKLNHFLDLVKKKKKNVILFCYIKYISIFLEGKVERKKEREVRNGEKRKEEKQEKEKRNFSSKFSPG